jgi:D-alanyl-D-alanine endopeptidase (penicillin-binding protein 7)
VSFLLAVGAGAAGATAVALALDVASRRWRRRDPTFWHLVWRGYLGGTVLAVLTWLVVLTGASAVAWIYWGLAALLLIWLAAGWWRVRRIARQAFAPASAHTARLAQAYGRPDAGGPMFRTHPRLQTPVTVGWRRPVILLPATWPWWPAARLDVVVRHELAHVARGDYVTSLLTAVAAAVLWATPGAWIAARRLRWYAELAADRHAAAIVGRAVYVQQLLEAAAPRIRRGSADLHQRLTELEEP